MTVLFGNTLDAFMVDVVTGAPKAGLIFNPYVDAARTTRATGLTNEAGDPSDSEYPTATGRIVGKTVTSKVFGALSFGAPDGTTKLYYDRGDGVSAVLYPQAGPVNTGGGGMALVPGTDGLYELAGP